MKMKKRALSIVLTLAMLVTMVPMMGVTANGETITHDTTWYYGVAEGVGDSADNPYLIHNTAQLEGLYQIIKNWNEGGTSVGGNSTRYDAFTGKHIKLADDFDGSAYMTKAIGYWFDSSTGGVYRTFNGSFDGNGKTVNLSFSGYTTAYIGLFAAIGKNGCVKNLIVNGNNDGDGAVSGASYVGGIAGYLEGSIVNCCVTTTNTCGSGTNACVGGIAGYAKNESNICNCYFAGGLGSSGGNGSCGWFIGKGESGSKVNNSYYNKNNTNVKGNCAIGSCTATDCVGINYSDQMKAALGTQNDGWDQLPILSSNKGALVDALNAYVNNNSTGGYCAWTVNAEANGGYPSFADGVCKIGNTKYATIAEALAAVTTNTLTTITLLKDITANVTIPTEKKITIDLNNHLLKGTGDGSVIANNGTLTIKDSTTEGTPTATAHYFTDSKCAHGIAIGNTCDKCGGTENKAVKDGCFETLYTGNETPAGTAGTDYIMVTGGCISGGKAENGGGINNDAAGNLEINGVNIIGNTAKKGGGVYNEGTLTISSGSITGNLGEIGGGLYDVGTRTGNDTGINNNSAKYGYNLYDSNTTWYTSGAGTQTEPFIVGNTEGLEGLASVVNGGNTLYGKYIKLDDCYDNSVEMTTPIGIDEGHSFKGNFDGNGKTVNLYMNYPSQNYVGLFGYLGGSNGSFKISNCKTTGTLVGNEYVGGIAGTIDSTSPKLSDCESACIVIGNSYVGGVVGKNNTTIEFCSSTGKVTAKLYYVGGIAGYNFGYVYNCYATGDILGTQYVGGVVGNNRKSVINCYSTGTVTGTQYVGGVGGNNDNADEQSGVSYIRYYFANCYSTGTVTGTQYVGGVVGDNSYNSRVCNCYFNKSKNNTNLKPIGLGSGSYNYALAEEQMKAAESSSPNQSWEEITVDGKNIGRVSLIDALNRYVEVDPTAESVYWTKVEFPNHYHLFEVGGGNYTTITSVISKLQKDGVSRAAIRLQSDISENVTIPAGYSISIDLNKHKLTATTGAVITNNGNLIIADTQSYGEGLINPSEGKGVEQNGKLILKQNAKISNVFLKEGKTITLNSAFSGMASVSTEKTPKKGTPIKVTEENRSDFIEKIFSYDNKYHTYNTVTNDANVTAAYSIMLSFHDTSWYKEGVGSTAENPYTIKNIDQLEGLAALMNDKNNPNNFEGKFIKLADDFVSSGALTSSIGNQSTYDSGFKGSFDGNGKMVQLDINTPSISSAGFFGYVVWPGTVKNLSTTGKAIGKDCAGGITGNFAGKSIYNCFSKVTCRAYATDSCVGGIAGKVADMASEIVNCYATGSVDGTHNGQIVGSFSGRKLENCYSPSVSVSYNIINYYTQIINCINIPVAQMSAKAGSENGSEWVEITVEGTNLGKVALVDALNAYVDNNNNNGLLHWYVNNDYPQLLKSCKINNTEYGTISEAIEAIEAIEQNNSEPITIILLEDVKENITIPTDKNVVIDLNNHDLKGTGKGSVINNNGTLTIKDSTLDGDHPSATTRYFTDSKCVHGVEIGGDCDCCDGKKALKDGCFETLYTGDTTPPPGQEGVDYIMVKGGCITGGKAECGGGINNSSNGDLAIKGVNFIGNTATGNGGGLYNEGRMSLTDVTIRGNSGGNGGGVFVTNNGSVFLGGSTVIFGNVDNNKVANNLVAEKLENISNNNTNGLKEGADIHITLKDSNAGSLGSGFTEEDKGRITIDNVGYKVIFDENKMKLEEIKTCKIDDKNYKTIQEAINDNSQSTDPTTITLLEDTTENITIHSGRNIVLDLKGKKLSANSGAVITNEGTLTITDTTTEGTPGSLGGGTGVKGVEQKPGTLTLAGKAKINNIYLHEGQNIKVDSGFSGEATVSTKNAPVNATPVNVTSGENSSDFSGKITAFNNTDYKIYNTGSGNNQKLILSVHEHTWNYSVGTTTTTNDTLKAYCSETFGTTYCSYNTEAKAQKVTIIKPALTTYGETGSEKATLSAPSLGALTLADNSIKYIGISGTEYSESTAAPTAAGKYKASITVGNGEDAKTAYVEYTIAEAPSTITTTPKAVSNLSYDKDNPQPQPLINAGQVEHGTIYYALGDNSTNAPTGDDWSTAVPTATEAGTYYVWYKVVGKENYAGTTPTCITVKISSEKDCWLLNLIKKIFSCKCLTTISTRLIDRFNSIFKNIFK